MSEILYKNDVNEKKWWKKTGVNVLFNKLKNKNEKKQLLKHLAGTFCQAQTFKLGGVIAAYIIL